MIDKNGIKIKEGDKVKAFLTYLKSFGRAGQYHCTGVVVMHKKRLRVKVNGINDHYVRVDKFRDNIDRTSQIEIINPQSVNAS